MNDTDEDEQGVQVRSCIVRSGSASLSFIENYCVVPDKARLFRLPGFVSGGKQAIFPIKLFALEESKARNLIFECVIRICSRNCNGPNCPPPASGRKRRAAGDRPSENKTITMATKIEILPNDVLTSGFNDHQIYDGGNRRDRSRAPTFAKSRANFPTFDPFLQVRRISRIRIV
ncbi:uncharacterized protein LOC135462457 [Liolophura sinensis]|uniref:uncharacterized protein LOC135462457 n=1 Tax=Liolophura sinensis TaxID=3198878 RepID=UPI00315898F8